MEEVKKIWEPTKNYKGSMKKPRHYDDDYGFEDDRKHRRKRKGKNCLMLRE